MKSILAGILALTITATSTAWCQQAASIAQPTPASPQAAPAGPDLAATMKALEEKLRSRGLLTWTENVRIEDGPVQRDSLSNELINVTADPKTCSLRAVSQTDRSLTNGAPYDVSVYLEEISGADVLTTEDYVKGSMAKIFTSRVQVTVEPPLYSVRVDSWDPFDFMFPNKDAADQFAALLREAIKQCSAVAVTPRLPASGSPGLTETLSFIADKLSTQGRVASSGKLTKDIEGGGHSYMPVGRDVIIFQVSPRATTCTMRIDSTGMGSADSQLSFRRVGKIEVIKFKDYLTLHWASSLADGFRITDAPSTFVLEITAPGGESKELYFSDETVANRVAKAIKHAAELCGAGANKEPF